MGGLNKFQDLPSWAVIVLTSGAKAMLDVAAEGKHIASNVDTIPYERVEKWAHDGFTIFSNIDTLLEEIEREEVPEYIFYAPESPYGDLWDISRNLADIFASFVTLSRVQEKIPKEEFNTMTLKEIWDKWDELTTESSKRPIDKLIETCKLTQNLIGRKVCLHNRNDYVNSVRDYIDDLSKMVRSIALWILKQDPPSTGDLTKIALIIGGALAFIFLISRRHA